MRILSSLLIATLATSATAQIKLPKYSSTYSYSHIRGYYFTAPKTMTVTHLQVPDEQPAATKGDGQVAALYRLKAAPTSVSETPVFYIDSVPTGQRIPVLPPVTYQQGEVVVVLGGMGLTTGYLRNSYGAGAYQSSVLGAPITLSRAGQQINIATTKGVGAVFGATAGSIARVRMWVVGHGSAEQYGIGSPGVSLDYADENPPVLGGNGGFVINAQGATTASAVSIGLLRSNILTPIGVILSSPQILILIDANPVPAGGRLVTFPIPNSPSLAGSKLTFQAGVGTATGLSLTNGMEWVVN